MDEERKIPKTTIYNPDRVLPWEFSETIIKNKHPEDFKVIKPFMRGNGRERIRIDPSRLN